MTAVLTRITGTLAHAQPLPDVRLYELVRVGERGLLGEVIRIERDVAVLQIYEDTTGLTLGAPVVPTGAPLAVELGPGLLGSILDGVGRPLARLADDSGDFIVAGATAATLERERCWQLEPRARVGDELAAGDVIAVVEEQPGFEHRIMVPPGAGGRLLELATGQVCTGDRLGLLSDGTELGITQRWPLRTPRPVAARLPADRPLITGQRIFDFLFPVAEGGTVAVPGGFGTGKTVIEQSLAKFAATDIVIFVGCGERGNEMSEVLHDFPRLVDPRPGPRCGRPLMERTVLVVNTSNMPVVAREASVYLGITIGELYRDMGYRVAVMVDSLSRWAEALRDIGARLQEMPGEEGYPTYMASRLGQLYERSGRARANGHPQREGALSLVCAVSPPGGDFSEPVTQASLRVAGAMWALDAGLAHQRQFPAVDWSSSYSLYTDTTQAWFAEHAGGDWPAQRQRLLALLQRDGELREIASLLGAEAMQDADRVVLEVARMVREHLLGQSAFDQNDAYSSVAKTALMARLAVAALDAAERAVAAGAGAGELDLAGLRRAYAELRRTADADLPAVAERVTAAIDRIIRAGARAQEARP